MTEDSIVLSFGCEAAAGEYTLEHVAVVPGRLALSQPEDVGETERDGYQGDHEGSQERRLQGDEQYEEQRDARADAAHEPPEETSLQSPRLAFGIGRGVGIGEAEICFHGGSGRRVAGCAAGSGKIR